MKVPIPDDWNGDDWACVQIQWPDSQQFWGLLNGLMSLLTRGRYWEENTGNIKDMQEIAWEIFQRNVPYTDCDGQLVEPLPPEIFFASCSFDEMEETMSLCGYNPNAFKIEDGKFYVKNFCGEWVEIGDLASPAEEPPPDIWDGYDTGPEFYACGKVNLIIDQFVLLSDAAWANYENPITFEAAMRGAVSDAVNLDRVKVYQWIPQIILLEPVLDGDWFSNEEMVQRAKCLAVSSARPTGLGTDGEVDAVVTALGASMVQQFGTIPELYWTSYWKFVQETFGSKDSRLLMEMGATDDAADCACPGASEGETMPSEGGWYLSAERSLLAYGVGGFDLGYGSLMESVQQDIYGIIFKTEWQSGDPINKAKRSNDPVPATGFDNYMHGSNSDDWGTDEDWKCQVDPDVFDEIEGSKSGGMTWMDFFDTSDVVESPVNDKGEIVLSTIGVQATGDPASNVVLVTWCWLYNANSASHS